jgi:hypothetical protein
MEHFDTYLQRGEPNTYTFVFRPPNGQGDWPMLRMPDNSQWPYSPFLYGEYHLGGDNSHLGERVLFHTLGAVVLDRFEIRLGY